MTEAPKEEPCTCADCRAGDKLPRRLHGIPNAYQLRLPIPKREPRS